jgi:putative ABC transport system permease protein
MVDVLPLGNGGNTIRYVVDGQPPPPGTLEPEANIREVSPNYFAMMGVPIIDGAAFDGREREGGEPVVIVNRALAMRAFGGHPEAAVGQAIRFTFSNKQPPRRIVAVVGDEHLGPLDEAARPAVYTPLTASDDRSVAWLVRGRLDGAALRRAILAHDDTIAVADIATMEELIERAPWMFVRRFPALLVAAFAALALFLPAIGIYGVLSYTVRQRTHELGIRRAVGASPAQILALILGGAARRALVGLGLGLVGALAAGELMRSLLYEIAPWDPLTLGAVAAGLLVIALTAAFVPARAALRVDPLEALR